MSGRDTRIFLALDDTIDHGAVRAALPHGSRTQVATLDEASARMAVLLAAAPFDMVVIGCSEYSERALQAVSAANGERPEAPVVVLYSGTPNGFMEAAFEAGADDLITLPQASEQVAFALEKVIARRKGAASSATAAPMISVLGPKGGTGKTLTSCNLAVALANQRMRPILIDLDLQFGDVGLALGLSPTQTIYDLAMSAGSLDGDKIDTFVTMHESGAAALLAPVRPDQAAAITVPFLHQLFEILRSRYDFVIVDTPPSFSPEVIAAVDSSSHLCMVGTLDALSLKDTKIGLETLEQMGRDPAQTTLVLNRADTNVGISADDVERLLGGKPDVLVPSDVAIPRATTHGRPIVVAEPRSGAARAFATLAERYVAMRFPTTAPIELSVRGEDVGRRGRRGFMRKAS
ncbi:MAG: pilus assembly protein CpaE [Gaiellaceae bacterium]|jgi:pilus assembly protein CpaE|nr:pilus assembly protein CpaE [Gaiellaceae bacterium]